MTELEALLTLNASRALLLPDCQRLLRCFGSASAIVAAGEAALVSRGVVSAAVAARLAGVAREFDAPAEIARAADMGIELVPHDSAKYPANLKDIPDPPILLYVKGKMREGDRLAIAIVGSRRCSHYGRTQAERLALQLASSGLCIVSGLAYGIDAAAHRGALNAANGRTLAVQGCGLARAYPAHHDQLAAEICARGALISELPLDTPPSGINFPARNRLISGLSLGVVVVEAAKRSGSLITASWAGQQGREVFAVPGPLDSPVSQGTNALIRDGARLVQSAKEIIAELGPLAQPLALPDGTEIDDPRRLALSGSEAKIFSSLSPRPISIEELIQASGLPAGAVNGALLTLEMRGLAQRLVGNRFCRT